MLSFLNVEKVSGKEFHVLVAFFGLLLFVSSVILPHQRSVYFSNGLQLANNFDFVIASTDKMTEINPTINLDDATHCTEFFPSECNTYMINKINCKDFYTNYAGEDTMENLCKATKGLFYFNTGWSFVIFCLALLMHRHPKQNKLFYVLIVSFTLLILGTASYAYTRTRVDLKNDKTFDVDKPKFDGDGQSKFWFAMQMLSCVFLCLYLGILGMYKHFTKDKEFWNSAGIGGTLYEAMNAL